LTVIMVGLEPQDLWDLVNTPPSHPVSQTIHVAPSSNHMYTPSGLSSWQQQLQAICQKSWNTNSHATLKRTLLLLLSTA